jgi:cation transport regulator ChaB
MPYSSASDLPSAIRSKYRPKCQRAFVGAFNSVYDKTHDEGRSMAAGHAAAKRCQGGGSSVTNAAASAAKKLPPLGPGEFRFITNSLSGETHDGKRRFRAVASSTVTDLAGNTISAKALGQMRDDFRAGLPIFMDHDYTNVVDKVFGMTDGAEIVQTQERDPRTNEPIYDLIVEGNVNEPNPRAVQLHDSISGGYVKFGASIGAIVRQHKRDKETGGMLIDGIQAKEASIVGIAKNQRSWVFQAAAAAENLPEDEYLSDDPEEDEGTVIVPSGVGIAGPIVTLGEGTITTTITTNGTGDLNTVTIKSDEQLDDPAEEGFVHEHDHSADQAPESESDKDDDEDAETTPGGQEAPAATPETAPTDSDEADPAIEQKADLVDVEDVAALVQHAKKLVERIGQQDAEIAALREELTTVKAGYDRLSSVEKDATETIAKVMSLPLSRRAVGHVTDLTARYPGLDPRVASYVARATSERSE